MANRGGLFSIFRKFSTLEIMAWSIVLIYLVFMDISTVIRYNKLVKYGVSVENNIRDRQKIRQIMVSKLKSLNNPEQVELLIREKMGYVKKGETLIRFY